MNSVLRRLLTGGFFLEALQVEGFALVLHRGEAPGAAGEGRFHRRAPRANPSVCWAGKHICDNFSISAKFANRMLRCKKNMAPLP